MDKKIEKLNLIPARVEKMTYLAIVIPLTTLIPFFTFGLIAATISIANKNPNGIIPTIMFILIPGSLITLLLYAFFRLRKKFKMIPVLEQNGTKVELNLADAKPGKEYQKGHSDLRLTFVSDSTIYTCSITGDPYFMERYFENTKDNPPTYVAYLYNNEMYMLLDDFYTELNKHINDKN